MKPSVLDFFSKNFAIIAAPCLSEITILSLISYSSVFSGREISLKVTSQIEKNLCKYDGSKPRPSSQPKTMGESLVSISFWQRSVTG